MANVVFGPTMLAYIWIAARYIVAGLILYALFLVAAYQMQLFEHVKSWPTTSKAAVFSGPLLIGVGLYYSMQPASYWMIVPVGIYGILSIIGGLALVGKFNS